LGLSPSHAWSLEATRGGMSRMLSACGQNQRCVMQQQQQQQQLANTRPESRVFLILVRHGAVVRAQTGYEHRLAMSTVLVHPHQTVAADDNKECSCM
jgi:hypothetical protein